MSKIGDFCASSEIFDLPRVQRGERGSIVEFRRALDIRRNFFEFVFGTYLLVVTRVRFINYLALLFGMQRKTPEDIVELIQNLYRQDLPVAEITRRTNIPYATVWGYTAAKKKGFASRTAYQEHLAKQRGFASYGAYEEHLAKKKGFASRGAYQEDWAKKKGFASLTEYEKHLAKQRQQQPENRELSDLIKRRLREKCKNQTWLARKIGVTRQAVSLYAKGKIIPNEMSLRKLFLALEVNYQTIDDLVE